MSKVQQINNLKIRYNKSRERWQVIAPDKRVLEEFVHCCDAVQWARDTYDFVRR